MRGLTVWLLLLGLGAPGLAQAQLAPKQVARLQTPAPPKVGASDIFAALTRPDTPATLEALRGLRDLLNGAPDADRLEAARAQLVAVLQAEERHQGDMPPALVMSGLANRIEAAIAGLEEARRPPPPDRLQAFLVPGLAALASAFGVALMACLAGLAARGRQAEDREELQDTLKKIRRRLEGTGTQAGAGGALAHDLAEMASGEASEAARQAAMAVDRLGSAARDAEGRLHSAVSDAEARLDAAAGMAGQLEQWMEALPARLTETVQAMEAHGSEAIDAACHRMDEVLSPLGSLPDLLADYGGAVSGLREEAAAATAALRGQVSHMAEWSESFAAGLPGRFAAALPQAVGELNDAADLIAELSNLAIGQVVRLEEATLRADKVACDLPVVAQLLEASSANLRSQIDQDAKSAAAASAAIDVLSRLAGHSTVLAEALPERLEAAACAVEARMLTECDRVAARLESTAVASLETVSGQLARAADSVQERFTEDVATFQSRIEAEAAATSELLGARLLTTVDAVGSRLAGRAELLQAGLEAGVLNVANAAAALPAIHDGLKLAASTFAGEAASQAGALREAAASLGRESAALLEAARQGPSSAGMAAPNASSAEAADAVAGRLAEVTAHLETVLATAETARVRAMAEADTLRTRDADQAANLLDVLAARAEACLGALPAESAALAAAAAQLRSDAAELGAVAAKIAEERGLAGRAQEPNAAVAALETACRRQEETLARLVQAGVSVAEEASCIGRAARQVSDGSDTAQAALTSSAMEAAAAVRSAIETLGDFVSRGLSGAVGPVAAGPDALSQIAGLSERLASLLDRHDEVRLAAFGAPAGLEANANIPGLDLLAARADRLADVLDRAEAWAAQPPPASAPVILTADPAGQDVAAMLAAKVDQFAVLLGRAEAWAASAPASVPPVIGPAAPEGDQIQATPTTLAGRIAALLEQNENLAAGLADAAGAVSRMVGTTESRVAEAGARLPPRPNADSDAQAAIETVQRAASRLLASAEAQEAALARASQAAADVARMTLGTKATPGSGSALAGLTGLAGLAEVLQGEAESLAASVLRGETLDVPADLVSQTPVMLAAIETSIHRLRGTATALALASDARLKAA